MSKAVIYYSLTGNTKEAVLADRHSDKAKDNKEKLEQFVKDIK